MHPCKTKNYDIELSTDQQPTIHDFTRGAESRASQRSIMYVGNLDQQSRNKIYINNLMRQF